MATEPAKITGSLKLGTDCELDLRAYELRRSGRPLKLERIPMELLILLVEHRGELVVRQQILARIWGENVCLDADNSINAAIRKLRQALRDDPTKPRFIQTVTGKGYRFIAPVAESAAPATAPAVQAQSPLATPTVAEPPSSVPEPLGSVPAVAKPVPEDSSKPGPRTIPWAVAAAVFACIAALGFWAWSRWQHSPSRPQGHTVLAVLPLHNQTGDTDQDYFADGLTEELISRLGDIDPQSFGVIAPSSVMAYKDSNAPLDEIARKLKVQYVLEGTVGRETNRIRINLSLVSVADRAHLWTKSYTPDAGDLLITQAEIADKVASEIRGRLGKTPRPGNPVIPTTLTPDQLAAHDLYLKGLYFWNKRSVGGLKLAISYFEQAVQKDPKNARAYAGLADSYSLISGYDSSTPVRETIPKARQAARHALELDPSLPEVHTALALIAQNYDWDWQTAESEYRRAIELNGSYATAHHWYGEMLGLQGRFDEGFREFDRAQELDPLSLIIATDRGMMLFYSRQYDRAIEQFRSVMDRDPEFPRVHMISAVYVEKGLYAEANADLEKWKSASGAAPWWLATSAYIYGREGDKRKSAAAIQKLVGLNRHNQLDPATLFNAYLGEGEKELALRWLEKAYAAHSPGLTNIKVSPGCDPLRQEPRFRAVLRGMNLE